MSTVGSKSLAYFVICLLCVSIVNKSKKIKYQTYSKILFSKSTPLKTPCQPLEANLLVSRLILSLVYFMYRL